MNESLPFLSRLWLAWVAFARILVDGGFAARVQELQTLRGLPPGATPKETGEPEARPAQTNSGTTGGPSVPSPAPNPEPALQLLALFQREGRFVDFLQQDLTAIRDEQVGSVARVVHQGCRKALLAHLQLLPIRTEAEGSRVVVEEDFSASETKLTGNLQGSAPFRGVLRHRGWRADSVRLPVALPGHDVTVLAPAEVEL